MNITALDLMLHAECHRATGRMRPRSTIRGRDVG